MSTRLRVDPIACTAHGMCAELVPERIALDDWGYPLIADPTSRTSCCRTPAAPPPRARRSPCSCNASSRATD